MPAGLTNVFLICGTLLFAYAFKMPDTESSTICVILMGFVGFLMLFRVCSPFNLKRRVLWCTMFTGFLIAILFFGRFFDLHSLSLGSWLVFIVFTLLAVPTIRSITILMNKGADLWNKHISPWTQKVREKWNER